MAERRATPRFVPLRVILCKVELSKDGEPLPAMLIDVAEGGIGLRTRQSLSPETSLKIVLSNRHGLFACLRRAVVRYISSRLEGDFQIGCEFDIPLDPDMLRVLHS
jgi:hypothetical protein